MKRIIKQVWNLLFVITSSLLLILSIVLLLNPELLKSVHTLSTTAAWSGTLILVFMLVSKNIWSLNPKLPPNIVKFLRFNVTEQKYQGLVVFNLFTLHTVISIVEEIHLDNFLIYLISGLLPFIIIGYLAITSVKSIQTILPNWKKQHSIIWIVFPLIIYHLLVTQVLVPNKYLILAGILIISVILGLIYQNTKTVTRSKRQLLLLLVAFSVILFENPPITYLKTRTEAKQAEQMTINEEQPQEELSLEETKTQDEQEAQTSEFSSSYSQTTPSETSSVENNTQQPYSMDSSTGATY